MFGGRCWVFDAGHSSQGPRSTSEGVFAGRPVTPRLRGLLLKGVGSGTNVASGGPRHQEAGDCRIREKHAVVKFTDQEKASWQQKAALFFRRKQESLQSRKAKLKKLVSTAPKRASADWIRLLDRVLVTSHGGILQMRLRQLPQPLRLQPRQRRLRQPQQIDVVRLCGLQHGLQRNVPLGAVWGVTALRRESC